MSCFIGNDPVEETLAQSLEAALEEVVQMEDIAQERFCMFMFMMFVRPGHRNCPEAPYLQLRGGSGLFRFRFRTLGAWYRPYLYDV